VNRDLDPGRHVTLVRYLLDQLSGEERDRLEVRLLADGEFQEELTVAEEEIADLYVKGWLPPEQQRLLERKFSESPEWKVRIDLARVMNRAEAELAVAQPTGWRKWLAGFRALGLGKQLAALASIVAILGVWLVLGPGRKDKDAGASSQRFLPAVPSFLLAPAVRKDAVPQSDNIVLLPERPGLIELRLPLDRDFYRAYQVQLQSLATGQTVSLGSATPVRERSVKPELRVPVDSAKLQPGRYTIVLQAAEADGSVTDVEGYSFRVATAN